MRQSYTGKPPKNILKWGPCLNQPAPMESNSVQSLHAGSLIDAFHNIALLVLYLTTQRVLHDNMSGQYGRYSRFKFKLPEARWEHVA